MLYYAIVFLAIFDLCWIASLGLVLIYSAIRLLWRALASPVASSNGADHLSRW